MTRRARPYSRLPVPRRPPGLPWPSGETAIAVTVREAAELAGVKPDAIRARIKTGRLQAFRPGRRMVVRIADLARYRRPGYASGDDMSVA
jgi:excisionase family DNA binding protein